MSIPRGIPSVTYLRINGNQHQTGWIDVLADGPNSVSIMETDQPISRHEVTQVLDRTLNDEEVCEHIIGTLAGASLGVALNPISAFVLDAATSLILLIGSKQTKKWQFMKQIFLKFLANELYANQLADKEVQVPGFYSQVSLTAFEINNELITDLLAPQSRGFPVSFSAEEGVSVPGLHRQFVNNEMELRQYFETTTDNRSSFSLAPGASIDTSTGIWELELRQNEQQMPGEVTRFTKSRLVVVDLAAIDPLMTLHAGSNNTVGDGSNLWGGYRAPVLDTTSPQVPLGNLSRVSPLAQSIAAFEEVVKRLSIPSQCPLAPFKASKLTYYLSELLGGNAVVAAIGFLSQGEAAISRKTLEIMESLTRTVHYPIGGREFSDATQGLIRKYRAMTANATFELENNDMVDKAAFESLKQGYEDKITEIEANFQEMDKELQTTLQSLETTVTELETLRQKEKEQEESIANLNEMLTTLQKETTHQNEEHEQQRSEWNEKQIANEAIAEENKVLLQKKEELVDQIKQLEDAKVDLEEDNKEMAENIAKFETAIELRNAHDEEEARTVTEEKENLMKEIIRLKGLITALEEDKQNLVRTAEKLTVETKEQDSAEETTSTNSLLFPTLDTESTDAQKLDTALQTIQKLERELDIERRRQETKEPVPIEPVPKSTTIDEDVQAIIRAKAEVESQLEDASSIVQGQIDTLKARDDQLALKNSQIVKYQAMLAEKQQELKDTRAQVDRLQSELSKIQQRKIVGLPALPVAESMATSASRTQESLHTTRSRTPEALHTSRGTTTFGDNGELMTFRTRHNQSFRLQHIEVEDRATKLLQKNAELEEELASYKEYMKKSVMTLTKQKRDLEAQLRVYQGSMKGKSGPPVGLSKGASFVHRKNAAFVGRLESPEDSERLDSFEESSRRDSDDSDSGSDDEEGEQQQQQQQTVDNKMGTEKKR